MQTKQFKVAKILDEYSLIINGGSVDGVEVNDTFNLLDKRGGDVYDPDTQEVIGQMDLIKGTVEVFEVQEKMSICSTPEIVKYNVFTNINNFKNQQYDIERERLHIDLSQVTGGLRRSDEPIRLGDAAKHIKKSRKVSEA